jgi:hypothetical protein
VTILATGCGRGWPTVRSVADAEWLDGGGVATVDLLPIDVGVAAGPEANESPEAIADRFGIIASGEIQSQLLRRGYHVAGVIDWDGGFSRGHERALALPPDRLEATQASLSTFGGAQASAKGVLLTPYLPARLGEATGADATLYIGGWAYSGRDDRGVSAGDVAKVVLIAAFIVVIVAVAVIVSKKGGGGGGGGVKAGGGAAQAGGRVVGGIGSGVARAGGAAARGLGRVARAGGHVLRGFARGLDAFGRSHTHITVHSGVPVGPPPAALPSSGPSVTVLEMTLVDNQRGIVLWHARDEFPANPARPEHVKKAIARMMAGLPGRR